MKQEFQVHRLEWTDEKVKRFWHFYAGRKQLEETWFTKLAGNSVIRHARRYGVTKGNILDYGTGKGFLIEKILRTPALKNAFVYGCDFSPAAVQLANEKFARYKNYKGCLLINQLPSSLPAGFFDVVFLLEVIEHLTSQYIDSTLQEIYRVLKSGGSVVVTAPNDENLELSHVMCPDCGGIFHRMQHLPSFKVSTMKDEIGRFGFKPIVCKQVLFKSSQGVLFFAKRLWLNLTNRKKPNLLYIGAK